MRAQIVAAAIPFAVLLSAHAQEAPRVSDAARRLHQRWVRFIDRKKKPTTANVAIARELAGWCWSLAVLEE